MAAKPKYFSVYLRGRTKSVTFGRGMAVRQTLSEWRPVGAWDEKGNGQFASVVILIYFSLPSFAQGQFSAHITKGITY